MHIVHTMKWEQTNGRMSVSDEKNHLQQPHMIFLWHCFMTSFKERIKGLKTNNNNSNSASTNNTKYVARNGDTKPTALNKLSSHELYLTDGKMKLCEREIDAFQRGPTFLGLLHYLSRWNEIWCGCDGCLDSFEIVTNRARWKIQTEHIRLYKTARHTFSFLLCAIVIISFWLIVNMVTQFVCIPHIYYI